MNPANEPRRANRQKHNLRCFLDILERKTRTLRRVIDGDLELEMAAEEYGRLAAHTPDYDWFTFRVRYPGRDDAERFRAQVLEHLRKSGGCL